MILPGNSRIPSALWLVSSVTKGHQCPTLLGPQESCSTLYKLSVLVTTKLLLFPSWLRRYWGTGLTLIPWLINTISAILVLTDVIFHPNRDSSVLGAGIETYAVKSYSFSPTSMLFSLWIKCSVKWELGMFFFPQQKESSQVKQHLSACMNCNFLKHFDCIWHLGLAQEKAAWVNFLTHVICSIRDYSDWILLKQNIWWLIRNTALIKTGLQLDAKWQEGNNQQVRNCCLFYSSAWCTFQRERFSFCTSQKEAMAVPGTSQLPGKSHLHIFLLFPHSCVIP